MALGSFINPIPTDYISSDEKGKPNGVATLTESGKVDPSQLTVYTKVYSTTEEQVVGQWIDGKPIYQRTVKWECNTLGQLTSEGKANMWAYYWFADHDETKGLTIGQYIKMEGIAYVYNYKTTQYCWQPIPRECPDNTVEFSIGFGDFDSERIGVLFGTGYSQTATLYVTFEYTKP